MSVRLHSCLDTSNFFDAYIPGMTLKKFPSSNISSLTQPTRLPFSSREPTWRGLSTLKTYHASVSLVVLYSAFIILAVLYSAFIFR